jgi:hypothetical protein
VATPTITPGGATYSAEQSVVLATATPDAVIRYTLDGTDPTLSSPIYATSLTVGAPKTVKARAFKKDWNGSATTSAAFAFSAGTAPIPSVSVAGGDYAVTQVVTVTVDDPGATIRYTTNGVGICPESCRKALWRNAPAERRLTLSPYAA